jgi:SRSO17 transposase
MTSQEKVQAWIIDDTGFIKQGKHSVGVDRQYSGSAGKVTNCQVGVSLTIATETEHLPIDFELYLPKSWANNKARRKEGGIPKEVKFQTKPQLALKEIRRALDDGVPQGVVLTDSAYGSSSDFRAQLEEWRLPFSVGVVGTTTVFEVGADVVTPGGRAVSLRKLAKKLMAKGRFQPCTWREGTKRELSANFAMVRVVPCRDVRRKRDTPSQALWLLIEWREGEDEPANYFLSNLPETISLQGLVSVTMQRWRTERAYEDLKGELGLDHFEGRKFLGWHHHVTVVLCCYAFLVAERVRHFPPSAAGPLADQTHPLAA